MDIKITDFGMSRFADANMKTVCGTPMYIAPEALAPDIGGEHGYGLSADIW